MNFAQRALRHLTRSKMKTILLTLTFFIIANFVVVGFSISSAAAQAKIETRKKMNPVIEYGLDFENWYASIQELDQSEITDAYNNMPRPVPEAIEKMLHDERLKSMTWASDSIVFADGFTPIAMQKKPQDEQNSLGGMANSTITVAGAGMNGESKPNITMKYTMLPQMNEFVDGRYVLAEGRMISQEDIDQGKSVVVIEKELAETNNLKVGDTLRFNLFDKTEAEKLPDGANQNLMELEIVGIYENHVELSDDIMQFGQEYQHPSNQVIVPQSTFAQKDKLMMSLFADSQPNAQQPQDENYLPGSATIVLHDPLDVDSFRDDHKEALAEEFMKMDANDEMFQRLSKPLDTLTVFSDLIVGIVLLNAVVIITLVSALTLKTRETEIGVLLSIGTKKIKIVGQLFLELLITALLGFSLASITGSILSSSIGKDVLAMQVQSETTSKTPFYNFSSLDETMFNEVSQEEVMSSYDSSVSPIILIQIFVMGVGVVFISTLIPSMMVLRFNPKKILMSQN